MGRLGPLTSQALGRSPYDIVVPGEGESDPRAPLQMYDERGRPVNPETKRINKDVVRSHNEVMLVIGVAEPENGGALDAQIEARLIQHENEDRIGRRLRNVGRVLQLGGIWGLYGLRQRILLYREYSNIHFYELFQHERSQHSLPSLFLAGLPSFVLRHALERLPPVHWLGSKWKWVESGIKYVGLHLQLFVFMQHVGLLSPYPWVPGLRYFIPFSSTSPVPAPPPITSLSGRSVLQWLGVAAVNALPLVVFFGYTKLRSFVTRTIWSQIYRRLPTPSNRKHYCKASTITSQPTVESAAGTEPWHNDQPSRNAGDLSREEPTSHTLEGQTPPGHGAIGAVRRQSTFSNRGDDYVSDDEETEMLSATTLISFDVEATEASDTPPGGWSAELRPNIADPRLSAREDPVYADNALTRVPVGIAADILTVVLSQVLLAPYEAFALRLLTRTFLRRQGLPVDGIHELNPFIGVSRTAVASFLGLEMAQLIMETEVWAVATMLAALYRGCQANWSFFRVLHEKLWKGDED